MEKPKPSPLETGEEKILPEVEMEIDPQKLIEIIEEGGEAATPITIASATIPFEDKDNQGVYLDIELIYWKHTLEGKILLQESKEETANTIFSGEAKQELDKHLQQDDLWKNVRAKGSFVFKGLEINTSFITKESKEITEKVTDFLEAVKLATAVMKEKSSGSKDKITLKFSAIKAIKDIKNELLSADKRFNNSFLITYFLVDQFLSR